MLGLLLSSTLFSTYCGHAAARGGAGVSAPEISTGTASAAELPLIRHCFSKGGKEFYLYQKESADVNDILDAYFPQSSLFGINKKDHTAFYLTEECREPVYLTGDIWVHFKAGALKESVEAFLEHNQFGVAFGGESFYRLIRSHLAAPIDPLALLDEIKRTYAEIIEEAYPDYTEIKPIKMSIILKSGAFKKPEVGIRKDI